MTDFDYDFYQGDLPTVRQVLADMLPSSPAVPCDCGCPSMDKSIVDTVNGFNVVGTCPVCGAVETIMVVGQVSRSTLN